MTATDHRRPCRRCGHDERAHDDDAAFGRLCTVIVDRLARTTDPWCWCPGFTAGEGER